MFERVIGILSEFTEINPEEMTFDTRLVTDMGLNSLDVINVIVAFEEEFGIGIGDRAISGFQTIGNIVDYLEGHV